MGLLKEIIKRGARVVFTPFGFEIKRISVDKGEGFPGYLNEATKAGMDVNDWEESVLGWEASLPILEQAVFPSLREDFTVCELGVGTGRFSRHIAAKLNTGQLHLVDHSPWIVNFVREYFRENPRVFIHLNDGRSLPFSDDLRIDFIFSTGTFIALKLGVFQLYAREFFRVLKPGGHCIIDYIDVTTQEGWNHLVTKTENWQAHCYTYHAPETVNRVFQSAGFEIVTRHQMGKSTYIVVKKPGALSCDKQAQQNA